jgi:ABC-2 type transport system permease protein
MKWWPHLIASEIRKILAFRSDFWITFLGQALIQVLIARALWQTIFESTGQKVMEGFTLETMTLYYVIVPLGSRMLTGENMGFLSREIYEGTFTRYLIYPISFFHYKTLTYLTYSAFYGIQLALIFILFQSYSGNLGTQEFLNLLNGLFFFMMASFVYAHLSILIELLAIWADNIWSLMVMVRFLVFFLGGAYVPLSFFPDLMNTVLKFTPFPYVVSLPVMTTMGLTSIQEQLIGFAVLLAWALIFGFLSRLVWKKGQYLYAGVGI